MSERSDPYCYPGTNVLINSAGFRRQEELDRFEADAFVLAAASLNFRPVSGDFNISRLLETHRRLFHYVYSWAGQLRQNSGRMSKARESGYVVSYGPSEHVMGALSATFTELAADRYLRDLQADEMATKLAYY